jgi:hypothetical protein
MKGSKLMHRYGMITVVLLISLLSIGCSDLLLQLSDNGEVDIHMQHSRQESLSLSPEGTLELASEDSLAIEAVVEPEGSYTYRWYIDGRLLADGDNAWLILSGHDLSVGTHTLVVGVDISTDILVQETQLIVKEN